jgi:hypothetical protein
MTRSQRRRHARTFYVLGPLLIGLFAYAFVSRQTAAAHLREHAVTRAALTAGQTPKPEKMP